MKTDREVLHEIILRAASLFAESADLLLSLADNVKEEPVDNYTMFKTAHLAEEAMEVAKNVRVNTVGAIATKYEGRLD